MGRGTGDTGDAAVSGGLLLVRRRRGQGPLSESHVNRLVGDVLDSDSMWARPYRDDALPERGPAWVSELLDVFKRVHPYDQYRSVRTLARVLHSMLSTGVGNGHPAALYHAAQYLTITAGHERFARARKEIALGFGQVLSSSKEHPFRSKLADRASLIESAVGELLHQPLYAKSSTDTIQAHLVTFRETSWRTLCGRRVLSGWTIDTAESGHFGQLRECRRCQAQDRTPQAQTRPVSYFDLSSGYAAQLQYELTDRILAMRAVNVDALDGEAERAADEMIAAMWADHARRGHTIDRQLLSRLAADDHRLDPARMRAGVLAALAERRAGDSSPQSAQEAFIAGYRQ